MKLFSIVSKKDIIYGIIDVVEWLIIWTVPLLRLN